MKKSKKTIGIIAAAIVCLVVLWLIFRPTGKETTILQTSGVEIIDITSSVTATGTVEPVTEVEVGTQVSGIISKLYVDYNDEVKAGQLIAEMDKVTLEADLASSKAQLASAKTSYEYRQKEYNRIKALHDKELVSDSEYDEALYQYESAKSNYEEAQASIVKVERNLSYATITSPIDGVVISKDVEEGQTVAAGYSTPTLFTIAQDLTEMEVIADIDEADIGQVAVGQRVTFTVDAYPDDVFTGEVKQVRLEATTESNVVTYETVIDAPNLDMKLKPGLTANITVYTVEEKNQLAVPTKSFRFSPDEEVMKTMGITIEGQAVSTDSTRTLWVKNGNVISPVSVMTGHTSGDKTAVTSGISGDEEIVTGTETISGAVQKTQSTERSPFAPGPRGNDNKK